MKRTLTVASVILATIALASPAEAAPEGTPARACSLGTVDLKHPPLGYPVDKINEVAKQLGLAEATGLGLGCDKAVRTDPYSETYPYPKDGPVVLRASESDSAVLHRLGRLFRQGPRHRAGGDARGDRIGLRRGSEPDHHLADAASGSGAFTGRRRQLESGMARARPDGRAPSVPRQATEAADAVDSVTELVAASADHRPHRPRQPPHGGDVVGDQGQGLQPPKRASACGQRPR
ncbi:hypothetical protein TPA0598_13_00160 [Streptomyces lydicamycinicus]|uniref:Uncharacterized protein n=1 Tax=Streptomyces lydicamycinicus TaxID=1546107 RepID=A0A0P4RHI6_9ACTN|nr:hypothetical protein TPA0598_13_00160 [Streptomyces lydicamycinicus]